MAGRVVEEVQMALELSSTTLWFFQREHLRRAESSARDLSESGGSSAPRIERHESMAMQYQVMQPSRSLL